MKTHYQTLPRYLAWEEDRTGPGQWDRITGKMLGNWASLAAARASLTGKRLPYGLGFFADADSIKAAHVEGGLIELDFSATGLFAEKWASMEGSVSQTRSPQNITTHPWNPTIPEPIPDGESLDYTETKPTLDVLAAFQPTGIYKLLLKGAGQTLTGLHWAAARAGVPAMPDVGVNPYSGGPKTYQYPYNWSYQVIPGAEIGRGSQRLVLCTIRYTHQWSAVL
jgi:hypothetical protein